MNLLTQWAAEGIVGKQAVSKLTKYVDLLLEWNPRINLTGFKSREEVEHILLGESILAAKVLDLSGRRVLDIGSGGGVPGLIWAMYDPSIRVTSLEIREKKVAFQKEVLRSCSVDAEIVRGRFPEAVEGRTFDVLVSRAIRLAADLWAEASRFLTPGGVMVRFATSHEQDPGWRQMPISDRTTLLLRP